MAEETSAKMSLSTGALDDTTTQLPEMINTQSFGSLLHIDDDAQSDHAGEAPRQVLDFDASRSMSAGENEADLEVTTQVLDTLDSLDWSMVSELPHGNEMAVDESGNPTSAPLSPTKPNGGRILPDWMTSAPPVVTKRSVFLSTLNRHRKKQDLVEQEEIGAVSDSKYMYRDIMNPSDMNLDRVICFDVESTGFGSTDGIIEIGAVEYILGQRTGALFQSYVKPLTPINPHAAEVHGLTNVMLASAPSAQIVIPSFLSWVGSSPLVAHNARFDMRMYVSSDFYHIFCRLWLSIFCGRRILTRLFI